MNSIKTKIFLIAIISFHFFAFAQEDTFRHYKEYEVKNIPKTKLIVDANKEDVKNYFLEYDKENIVKISEYKYQLFDTKQAFTTKEDFDASVKKGVAPDDWLFTHEGSLSSYWEVSFKGLDGNKTEMEFELKKVVTNSEIKAVFSDNEILNQQQMWEKWYQNKKLVSRGIIEKLYEIYFRKKILPALHVANFSKEKGFDNGNYTIKNFIPNKKVEAKVVFKKQVPELGNSLDKKSILVYDRVRAIISLLDNDTGKTIWTKTLENRDSQNLNKFNIYKNTVYIATSSGNIYALSLKSGEEYWKMSPTNDTQKENVTNFFKQDLPISDDYLYANYNGTVYKINRYNGQIDWSQTIGNYGHYNYSFDNENLYKTGILECFVINKKSGEVTKIINNTEENTFYSPNELDAKNKMIYLSAGSLYAFNLTTDKVIWKYKDGADFIFKENTTLYTAVNGSLTLSAINSNSGDLLWENTEIKPQNGEGKTILDIYNLNNEIMMDIFVEDYSNKTTTRQLVFIDKKTGELNLINNITEKIISNPLLTENEVLLISPNKLLTINLKTKELKEKLIDFSVLESEKNKLGVYEHYSQLINPN
jgi:outer membrane protein assembly factor BamB